MISDELKQLLTEKDPFTDILGQNKAKQQIKSALLMNRHIILVGPPGIGKTTLAKNIARLLPDKEVNDCSFHCTPEAPICPECKVKLKSLKKQKTKKLSGEKRFIRIQGSPDLTVEDVLGDIDPIKAMQYGPLSLEAFTPGKIFKANNGILFFDELNRCPEKLQNSLLQVLEERKTTLGSYDVDIEANFVFIGTMNPEDSSTEKLSDVLLDRFDLIYMNYPETLEIEKEIAKSKGKTLDITFPEDILDKTIVFVRALRENEKLEKVPSVRATLGLYERAQSNAALKQKTKVDFGDVAEAIVSVIAHRIKLKPSAQYLQSPSEFLKQEIEKFVEDHKIAMPSEKGGGL